MSEQINVFNYQAYNHSLTLLAQQFASECRKAAMEEQMTGKRVYFDQVGAVRMQQKSGRAVDIPTVNTPHSRRTVTAKDFYLRDFIDEFDRLKILEDPTNAYSQSFAAAAQREIDKILIEAALGPAFTGEEGATVVPFPASQMIAAGGTGFTLNKLRQAVRLLKEANAILPDEAVHVFWTARQEEEFINTTEVKSSDFNTQKVMASGKLEQFYGCVFHRLEDVSTNERILPKAATTRSCVLWAKSGMKLGVWREPHGRIDYLAERDSWQVMSGLSAGATRMEEKKVVQLDCVES